MPKRLEWSVRAGHDLASIIDYYAEVASPSVARLARDCIKAAADGLVSKPVLHRAGKRGTRELVLKTFPYTVVYRATASTVRIVRVLHQARAYFNR